MLKPVLAATAILAIAGSTFVYAQQRFDGRGDFGDRGSRFEHRHRLSADDVSAFADARIAALKAGLELTPDQAKNWPAFETALRNMVQLRIDRIKARQAAEQQGQTQSPQTPFDRLARRADNMSKRSTALKQIADAGAPLYSSLNDAQKERFTMLARFLRPHPFMHARNDGDEREGFGRRFGQDGQGFGWGHDRRFGENDEDSGRHFDRHGPGMQHMMNGGSDEDSL